TFTATYNAEWVFGTEPTRLVVNEVYVEHPAAVAGTATKVNVWVELYNPFREDPALRPDYFGGNPIQASDITGPTPRGGVARLQMPASGMSAAYSIYQVALTQKNANLRAANNVLGDPDAGATYTDTAGQPALVTDFTDPAPPAPPGLPNTEWVYAGDNFFEGVNGKNFGFYLLGPKDSTTGNALQVPGSTLQNTLSRPEMQYNAPAGATSLKPTVMLRRLACPHMAPNLTKGPGYNPY